LSRKALLLRKRSDRAQPYNRSQPANQGL
jgi:hypothetical protein